MSKIITHKQILIFAIFISVLIALALGNDVESRDEVGDGQEYHPEENFDEKSKKLINFSKLKIRNLLK